VHTVPDEDAAFSYIKARGHKEDGPVIVDRFDPRRQAVVEASASPRGSDQSSCARSGTDRTSVERYDLDAVTLRVDAACPGLLVLPDTFFPGWTATVNGKKQDIYATDGAFRGVAVPTGKSVVRFTYAPKEFKIGVVLAATGLVAFGALATFLAFRRLARKPG
jgi:hypothetical protein